MRGGIETHLELLCRGLNNSLDLEVVVANEGRRELHKDEDGIHVRRIGTVLKLAGAPFCPELRNVMRNSAADIIHVHAPHPTALLTFLASGSRAALVCTYHSDIVRQKVMKRVVEPLQDLALRKAAAIIVSSPNLIEHSPVLRRHRDRCIVIPFGIDTFRYEVSAGKEVIDIRRKFGTPLLLAVGRLVYYKGFQFLIRALAQTKTAPNLIIIGAGPLRKQLQNETESLGLTRQVNFVGNVPNTLAYYQACDAFILPSVARSEAFGIVQLEAMACGKPVINTNVESGVPFVSRHNETGLTVPPCNSIALAGAIDQLLGDAKLQARFSTAARKRVDAHFTAAAMVESTIQLYKEVVVERT